MAASHHHNQDKDSTLYVGNLDERCTDSLVWELMLQCGPIINVHLPKDRVTQNHQGYGFVEFGSEEDADYAAKILNQIRVWGKPIRVNKASADRRIGGAGGVGAEGGGLGGGQGVGAELFVGNLDGMVDEKVLYETFSRFGPLISAPKIARDDANLSKGYGFVSYADFDASDEAIGNMHGQYLMNKEITVQYAYKKDGKGERHGDAAERALAKQAKIHGVQVAIPAMPASLVLPPNVPGGPSAMGNGGYGPPATPGGMNGSAPPVRPPPNYHPAPYGQQPPPSPAPYGQQPPASPYGQQQFNPYQPPAGLPTPLPNRGYNQSPLQPPPGSGLPARPPPSMAGYGGPAMGAPPPGFAAPPPGFVPPGPPGMPPQGMPPGMPPQGFRPPGQGQSNGYGQR